MNDTVGVISSDIVSSTSIKHQDKVTLIGKINDLLKKLRNNYECYGRITKGDQIELVSYEKNKTLRIALLIKFFIKSLAKDYNLKDSDSTSSKRRLDYFRIFGVRMAIEINEMDLIDEKNGILDGIAIHNTGRKINEMSSHNNQRIVIKESIHFNASKKKWTDEFSVTISLLDFIISKATPRQSEVLFYKTLNLTDKEIAEKLKIKQPTVNVLANNAGWREIEKTLIHFEKIVN